MAKKYKNKLNSDIRFTLNSILKVPRTTFNRNQKNITTFNSGDLVPLFCDEVLPGDTYSLDLGSVVRFNSALIRPVMDDAKVNVWAFFVPKRLVESNWQSLIANYRDNPDWTTDVNLSMSSLTIPTGGFAVDSVADHFGIPVGQGAGKKIVHAPIRAYCLIWDSWFKYENLQQSITVNTNFADTLGVNNINGSYLTDAIKGGRMCPLNKIHDYFTSALPAPQEGSPSIIGIGATAPVLPSSANAYTDLLNSKALNNSITFSTRGIGGNWGNVSGTNSANLAISGTYNTTHLPVGSLYDSGSASANANSPYLAPNNLYADLSSATAISVNDLRYAVQVQMIKETDARYGNRYKEFLLGHFGVVSADARLQIPEFLGSATFNIDTQQVAQTSSTDATTPQASVAAYSLTNNVSHLFTKSFTEHGYIIVVGGVRVAQRTYSQGLNKMWTRFTRFDNYFPELSHIGEQPILNQEIYLQDQPVGGDGENVEVFGYQEAWADYRYLPNQATGYMRPNVSGSLAVWNYADNYNSLPTLSGAWVQEDKANINRTLAIGSSETPMFLGDFYFKNKATRPMPLHSVPGLVDHSGKIII